ncbi:SET domain-containing protein SmydA-8-like [Daphnia carinata]|uniref:SET domain-containing protein SmydA-8-like n=1 Tax=Daphnia carinata TaxID=120202 RepID=UPI00257E6475|nr:SET domain-containing protein SmydA-8-like [Daphnia carinata]
MSGPEGKCFCGKEALQRCSGCQSVFYCSREHQKADWKKHRSNCRAYRVERTLNVGRRLIACRDLKAGDVILQEKPLVIGPKYTAGQVCLSCYSSVDGRTKCSQCGWPTCGRAECHTNDSDHAVECGLIASGGRPIVGSLPVQAYQSVMVLRCLALKDQNPGRWEELLQLESHVQERRQGGLEDVDRATSVRLIRDTLGLDVPEELILQLCGILMVNSFEQPPMKANSPQGLVAVYSTASLLEHDCVANAIKTFTNKGDIVIRAAVSISKGDKISLCYTEPLWGTVNRQRHLSQTKFFRCACERCKDPTELDTFISGLYCQKCPPQSGILLIENPLDETSDWVCRQCGTRQPANYVAEIIESVGKEIVALKKGSLKDCEGFLRKFSKILHPNHFYLTDVKMALCQMYGHLEGQSLIEMNDDTLNAKEALALELLKVADAVSPGMTRLRAILLYELQAVLSVRCRKLCVTQSIMKEELQANVKVVRKMLQESATIFSWEPEETDEGQLAVISAKELRDVDLFLKTLD